MSLQDLGYREQLSRVLTTRDLIIYGLVFMVPIAPFAVFGFVWQDAKGMVPLAYLLGLVGMFFTALSYAAMSRAFPVAGSVYAYAQHGLHEVAGFFAGWLILLDYLLIPSLLYIISAVAMRPILPAVPIWVWLVSFIGVNAIANWLGIEFTAKLNRYMLLIELLVLAAFVVLGLHSLYGGAGAGHLTLRPWYDPAAFSLATIAGATSIAVLSFLGFDGISTLAEENREAATAVGRATVYSLALVGVLFMLQTWIAADVARGMHLGAPETAFYDVSSRVGGARFLLIVVIVQVLASAIGNAMAAQAAVSRILFAMARDRKLPSILAKVHPRYRTPYVSILFVTVLSLGAVGFFVERLDDLTRIVNFGALSSFVLLHLAVIHHYVVREHSRDWLRHVVFPLIGLTVISYVLIEMDHTAKVLGAIWICAGAVYYAILKLVSRNPLSVEI
jgi:amino acid transporter